LAGKFIDTAGREKDLADPPDTGPTRAAATAGRL